MNIIPLNTIEISKSRILANASILTRTQPGVMVAPVLKANALGHGLELIGPLFDNSDFPFLCVNSLQEADSLRRAGVQGKILIMGYVDPRNFKKRQLNYSFTIFDIEQAEIINEYQKNPSVHLNFETGLHREGMDMVHAETLIKKLKELPSLQVEGIMSHLACSNDPTCPTTIKQLKNFKKIKEYIKNEGFSPTWFHLGGSLALINGLSQDCNVVRCGKALLGIGLNSAYQATAQRQRQRASAHGFSPVLTVKTTLAQIKKIKKGDHVSYADSFIAERNMTIGILPIGYSDGIDRRLSNKGVMLVDGIACKIIGVITMNVSIIDLSEVKNPHVGQEVIVFSANPTDPNSFDTVAKLAGTLPHEFFIRLPQEMSRAFVS